MGRTGGPGGGRGPQPPAAPGGRRRGRPRAGRFRGRAGVGNGQEGRPPVAQGGGGRSEGARRRAVLAAGLLDPHRAAPLLAHVRDARRRGAVPVARTRERSAGLADPAAQARPRNTRARARGRAARQAGRRAGAQRVRPGDRATACAAGFARRSGCIVKAGVSTAHTPQGSLAEQLHRVRLESDTLYRVIGVIASAPDLSRVLDSIVDLLTEATDCHACFVYLRDGGRLRLRAASEVYAHLVGKLAMTVDEGLSGCVTRHNAPAFIRDNAMDDPRMKYFAELEEEHFQSMVAVPIPSRSGDVLGTVVLHTEAPREFDEGVLNFLAHTASLVAGAIENARLYEDTRRRVEALTRLSSLSQAIAAVDGREDLYRVVTEGVRDLLRCDACHLYLLDRQTGRLELAAADPPGRPSQWPGAEGTGVLLELLRRRDRAGGAGATTLIAPVAAGDEHLGALAAGRDLGRRHVLLHVEPLQGHGDPRPWPAVAERTEARLRRVAPGALCDTGRESLRALVPLRAGSDDADREELERALRELGSAERVLIGMSTVH